MSTQRTNPDSPLWVHVPRNDGVRTFQLRLSDDWWYTVHIAASGRASVVRSPIGISLGNYDNAAQAFDAAEGLSREHAQAVIDRAERELADARRASTQLSEMAR